VQADLPLDPAAARRFRAQPSGTPPDLPPDLGAAGRLLAQGGAPADPPGGAPEADW
jgi:hypothetical protein